MLVAPVNSTMHTQLSGERNRIMESDNFCSDHISRLTLRVVRNPCILVTPMKQSVLEFIYHT